MGMNAFALDRSRDMARRLSAFPVLADVDRRAVRVISRAGFSFCLAAGEELERTGPLQRALIFILSGTMRVAIDNGRGELDTVAMVPSGETVGEMALLTDDPPSARLFAHRDVELFALERKAFEHVAARRPTLIRNLSRLLCERLRRTTQRAFVAAPGRSVALLAAHDGVPLDDLAYRLAGALRADGLRVICHDAAWVDQPPEWHHAMEEANDVVLHLAYPRDAAWRRQARRKADRTFFVDDGGRELAAKFEPLAGERLERVTLGWRLPAQPGGVHHLVRPNDDGDVARLARFLSGRAIGLVLSGGGARGFAHIGVVKALRAAGIPIDAVGGTSMGGIIAAGVASEWDEVELASRIREAFVGRNPMSDLTVPKVSFFGGRRVRELLARNFGTRRIEELTLPYFCVTADLTQGVDAAHREGELVERLRASVALPGLLPPVVIEGRVHVDGGVMNNLPVDHMARLGVGAILAVDVTGDSSLTPGEGAVVPGIISILMRSGTVGNEWQRREARRRANLLFDPPVRSVAFQEWHAFDRAASLGYEDATARLEAGGAEVILAAGRAAEVAAWRANVPIR
jgi:NTE family protein